MANDASGKKKHPAVTVRILRTLGLTFGIVAGIYFYQPQRYDFFSESAPVPNPEIDPNSFLLFSKGAKIAVVAAHPDDPEYYIGGTLLKLRQAGAKITIVMCTDGDKGYYPWFMTNAAENRKVRRAEQLAAAAHYDAPVYFLARRDGRLKADEALTDAVRQVLFKIQPNYVLTFDPKYPPKVQHSDHIQSGVAGISAAASVPSIKWILRFATHAPNYTVDVTKQWDERESLLAIHKSQFYGERLEQIRSTVEDRSSEEGSPKSYSYGEAFRCSSNPPARLGAY